ncbi:hypothetical protein OG432_03820 [Streptomyces sp. NBC_00442]|uniref:hypothetical protein n=1 Tax=Streptomyces sp. NBC_00442 TaxID=2903651 RepID=UPI002E1A83C5
MSTAEAKAVQGPDRDPTGGDPSATASADDPVGGDRSATASADDPVGGDRSATASIPDLGAEAGRDGPSGAPASARRPGRRTLALACVLALALLLLGSGLLIQARQLTHAPAAGNRALTDAGATTQVIGDVSNTLGKVFSYVPEDTRVTEDAAKDLLGGRAATQYAALFGELRQRVAEQKLTLTTHVVRGGVVRLTRDHAELLVFLDQRAQRDGKPATVAAAQLTVTAQLDDGHWRITDIQAR